MTSRTSKLQPLSLSDFGLSLVLLGLFGVSLGGHAWTGFAAYNLERVQHHVAPLASVIAYLTTGHFIASVAENMESEFLQMALFVYLTMCFYQRGSAESKKPPDERTDRDDEEDRQEDDYCAQRRSHYPVLWRFYENSLTYALVALFLVFFLAHAYGSFLMENEKAALVGEAAKPFRDIFGDPDFWFESFQNWQSEFFSILVLGFLTVFLRQRGSPQSKKMFHPHRKTGDS